MLKSRRGAGKVRTILVILIAAAILAVGWYAGGGLPETIGPWEAGVVMRGTSVKRVYQAGERPLVLPVLERLCRVTTSPQVVTLTGEEETVRSGDLTVESQVIYSSRDAAKAVESFTPDGTHEMIRKRLGEEISQLLHGVLTDPALLNNDEQRMITTAQVHVGLREAFEETGVSVDSYQIRVR